MIEEEDARQFAAKLSEATRRVVADYGEEDVVGEESFSEQLCGRLKETLEDFHTRTITWQAQISDRGLGIGRLKARSLTRWKEEPDLGADIVMVLDVETDEFTIRKGFLAQAKLLTPGEKLEPKEHARLIRQCEDMLTVTPSSMVFLYSTQGVYVVPAAAVLQARDRDLYRVLTHDIHWLYHDFAICWFGDVRIQATDRLSLEGLRERLDANAAVLLSGRTRDDDWDDEVPY